MSFGSMELVVFMLQVNLRERGFTDSPGPPDGVLTALPPPTPPPPSPCPPKPPLSRWPSFIDLRNNLLKIRIGDEISIGQLSTFNLG